MTRKIVNPVLAGFHPDPSFIRVGDDYYIATSTFEWFPGVEIHHSKDLVHWHSISRVLTEASQVDLRGNVSSGSIWAPALSYDQGVFYLLFTDVKSRKSVYKDLHNYLITATDIMGPWRSLLDLMAAGLIHFCSMIWTGPNGCLICVGISVKITITSLASLCRNMTRRLAN